MTTPTVIVHDKTDISCRKRKRKDDDDSDCEEEREDDDDSDGEKEKEDDDDSECEEDDDDSDCEEDDDSDCEEEREDDDNSNCEEETEEREDDDDSDCEEDENDSKVEKKARPAHGKGKVKRFIGKIYHISSPKDPRIYIGHTLQRLNKRLSDHRHTAKTRMEDLYQAMRKYGADTFSIKQEGKDILFADGTTKKEANAQLTVMEYADIAFDRF